MAKSYITKFTEYVKTCKDNLKTNLESKGQTVLDGDTLDVMVGKVANITPPPAPSTTPYGYTRDINLPDMDAMFDEDPLREVNGGEYRACAYIVGLMYQYSTTHNEQVIKLLGHTNYPAKLVVYGSNGETREYTITSYNSDLKFVVNDDELYTLADGRKCYIIKCYSNYQMYSTSTSVSISSMSSIYPLEFIADNSQSAGYVYSARTPYLQYSRYIAPITDSLAFFTSVISNVHPCCTGGTIRIDGNFKETSLKLWSENIKIELNGQYIGSTEGIYATSVSGSGGSHVKKVVLPSISQTAGNEGKCSCTISTHYTASGNSTTSASTSAVCLDTDAVLYIPDYYNSVSLPSSSYGSSRVCQFSTIHIPNSISKTGTNMLFVGSNITYPNLKNITISPNAFMLNTTAVTFYADNMPLLTEQSIANLVEGLGDRTGMTANIIRFTKIQHNLISDEQVETLQNKNWTVTFV